MGRKGGRHRVAVLVRESMVASNHARRLRSYGGTADNETAEIPRRGVASSPAGCGVSVEAREEWYHRLVDASPDAVIAAESATGLILTANPAAARLYGYRTPHELQQVQMLDLIAPDDRARFLADIMTLSGQDPGRHSEYQGLRRDNSRFPVEVSVSRVSRGKDITALLVLARDITERKVLEEQLKHQALHDALTDLPNRLLLQDRLKQAIALAHRDQRPAALLLMDLDGFKEINDTFGHQFGDRLLQQVSSRLPFVLRASDTVARVGGDEFAVVLPATRRAGALSCVRKIQAAIQVPFVVDGTRINIRSSVGVALYPEHGENDVSLLRSADVAMYAAKRAKTGHALYDPQHDPYSPARLALIDDLRRAIKQGELLLHYQPKVSLKSGRADHVEALVRWQHRQRGLIAPAEFIPLAEETGLIEPLTLWVLQQALSQGSSWRQQGLALSVAINLSVSTLLDRQLADMIASALRHMGMPASGLVIEITESVLMADPDQAMDALCRLHDLGVKISVDDFGTGYSSLSYLKRLPIDEVKVDRCFVMDMTANENDAIIVRSVIDLGHNLGLQVTAEGVEDEQAYHMLRIQGCDLAQGYYLSRPLPAQSFPTWLKTRVSTPISS